VTLGKDVVSVTRRRNGCFSLPSAPWPSAREKVLGKEGFVDALFVEPFLSSVFKALPSASGTRQSTRFQ
jgi:hypothetical protein